MSSIHANRSHETDRQWSAWMLAARAGDEAAYNALLRSCIPLIRRMARKQGVRSHNVDDVVQDTLLALHRARHDYESGRSFISWLGTITRRRVIDGLRRAGRTHALEIHAPLEYDNHPDADGDPAAAADELDRITRLGAALRGLPASQRRTVDMVLHSGSFSCAAVAVGCRPGSLRVSWHRALAALRARIIRSEDL